MRHVACMWGKRKYTQGFGRETKGKTGEERTNG